MYAAVRLVAENRTRQLQRVIHQRQVNMYAIYVSFSGYL